LAQGAIVIKIAEQYVGALGVSGAPGGEKDGLHSTRSAPNSNRLLQDQQR